MEAGNFAKWMKEEVEPFLKKCRKYGYFKSYDGTLIFYNIYSLPEAKTCIVISHGFCEFAEKYNEVIYRFLKAGYSVYLPEHRGHGYSDRKTDDMEKVHVWDYEEYVKDFTRFVEKIVSLRETHKVLFAHSMGGAIGALTLEQFPRLFEAAVFSSPMFSMKAGKWPEGIADTVARVYCRLGKGEQYAAGQGGFTEKADFPGSSCLCKERYQYIFEKRMQNMQYRTYGGSYAWVHAGIKATRRLMKKRNLEKIQIPVLLFAAGCDHMVNNGVYPDFVKHTKETELVRMPEAKHEIFNAKEAVREIYYRKIFEFLAKEREETTDERKDEQTGKILGYV